METLSEGPLAPQAVANSNNTDVGLAVSWLRWHGFIEQIIDDGHKLLQIVPPERGFRGMV